MPTNKKVTERDIEKQLRLRIAALGGKAYKFSSPGNNGVPDRIVLIQGKCFFVELKRPGAELSPRQRAVKRDFAKLGFEVYKVDSIDAVDKLIKETMDEI